MFKRRSWKKKYEDVYEIVTFWRDYYRLKYDEIKMNDPETLQHFEHYNAQAIALSDILHDMEKIAES